MFTAKLSKAIFALLLLGNSLLLQSSTPVKPIIHSQTPGSHQKSVDIYYFYYFKEFLMSNGCRAQLFYEVDILVDADQHISGIRGQILAMEIDCGPREYFARIDVDYKGRTVTAMRFVGNDPKIDKELNQFEDESIKLLNEDIQTIR